MAEQRIHNLARILVEYSAHIVPGDRVLIQANTLAKDLVQELFIQILQAGGHPYVGMQLPELQELLFAYGNDDQLRHVNELGRYAYENFESRIRIHSDANTKATRNVDPKKQSIKMEGEVPILQTQFRRGASEEFKWVTTMYPTRAYAMQADMGFEEYKDFVFAAAHTLEDDPVAYWQQLEARQQGYADAIEGHDKVELHGPNVELSLSIKDRLFKNAHGKRNMPDGEIFTGPVEQSVNGWVRFTYPSILRGNVVRGVELHFEDGKVVKASAEENQDFLRQVIATDEGASYLGEFAIGLNKDIDRFTGFILLDEKIGGSFHVALGRGYPETGSKNVSAIHWDMICDMRQDAEILVDGEVFYKDGKFTL